MLKVLGVFDRASGCYGRPFFVPHVGSAVRDFSDEINRAAEDNPLYKHPDDYDLYDLGNFNDANGFFVQDLHNEAVLLVRGKDVSRKE